jgi:hypothetical protein
VSAVISADGRYRYRLERVFPAGYGTVTFVMLNPSTADAEKDDPTIRRCKGFATRWGYSRLIVVNLFALRSTDPKALRGSTLDDAENRRHVLDAVTESREVIAAWGVPPVPASVQIGDVQYACWSVGRDLRCLGKTQDGSPRHPLYVRADKAREVWP